MKDDFLSLFCIPAKNQDDQQEGRETFTLQAKLSFSFLAHSHAESVPWACKSLRALTR